MPLTAAPAVFRGVSCHRLPFGGSATFLASCLSCSCSGALLLGLRCLGCVAWFSTWCRALPPGPAVGAASPAAGYPWGLLPFLTAVCLTYCCAGGVGWVATLPFCYSASPAPSGLQGFPGFCTLCQGAPIGVVTTLWTTM